MGPAFSPVGVSNHDVEATGMGVVGGGGVVTGGGAVGGGVIFQRGAGPSVGSAATVRPGRPGRPGSPLAGTGGNGGGGSAMSARGGGSGGIYTFESAGGGIVAFGATKPTGPATIGLGGIFAPQ